MLYSCTYESPMGLITLASDGACLSGLWLEGQKYHGGTLGKELTPCDDVEPFALVRAWLDRYFAGERPRIDELPLAPVGSAFRQRVWGILCEIPYGELTTYGAIAQRVAVETGKGVSGQAVGGAVGHNPISIIIPCHRVVGAGGNLTGYAGGIEKKTRLLEHEGVDMAGLFVPKRGTAL